MKMLPPKLPSDEKQRQAEVERYGLLDTLPEPNFDAITSLASRITDSPVSLITMLDNERNFLKSHHGIDISESPREISFCGHAINEKQRWMMIENAEEDLRFSDNPLVTDLGVRFYTGVPIRSSNGFKLGTLCVFDMKPKTLNNQDKQALIALADQVEVLLEQRMQTQSLQSLHIELARKNEQLKSFNLVLMHDLKTPLTKIAYAAERLVDVTQEQLSNNELNALVKIQQSAEGTCRYASALLDFYENFDTIESVSDEFDAKQFADELKQMCMVGTSTGENFACTSNPTIISSNKAALLQILSNIVSNAIKHNDKPTAAIHLEINESDCSYLFKVTDNGVGIAKNNIKSIFDYSYSDTDTAHNTESNHGLGLFFVKQLVERMAGEITVASQVGVGSQFTVCIPKPKSTVSSTNYLLAA